MVSGRFLLSCHFHSMGLLITVITSVATHWKHSKLSLRLFMQHKWVPQIKKRLLKSKQKCRIHFFLIEKTRQKTLNCFSWHYLKVYFLFIKKIFSSKNILGSVVLSMNKCRSWTWCIQGPLKNSWNIVYNRIFAMINAWISLRERTNICLSNLPKKH